LHCDMDDRVRRLMPASFTVFNFLELCKQQLTFINPNVAPPPSTGADAASAVAVEAEAMSSNRRTGTGGVTAAPLLSPLLPLPAPDTADGGVDIAGLGSGATDVSIGQLRGQLLRFVAELKKPH